MGPCPPGVRCRTTRTGEDRAASTGAVPLPSAPVRLSPRAAPGECACSSDGARGSGAADGGDRHRRAAQAERGALNRPDGNRTTLACGPPCAARSLRAAEGRSAGRAPKADRTRSGAVAAVPAWSDGERTSPMDTTRPTTGADRAGTPPGRRRNRCHRTALPGPARPHRASGEPSTEVSGSPLGPAGDRPGDRAWTLLCLVKEAPVDAPGGAALDAPADLLGGAPLGAAPLDVGPGVRAVGRAAGSSSGRPVPDRPPHDSQRFHPYR